MSQLSHLFVVAADPIKDGKVTMRNETTGEKVKLTRAEMLFLTRQWPYHAPIDPSRVEQEILVLEQCLIKPDQFTPAVKNIFKGLRTRMRDGDVPAEYVKRQIDEFDSGLRMFP